MEATPPRARRIRSRAECWNEVHQDVSSDQRHHRNTCIHCGAKWVSNNKSRVLQHLARCPDLPDELKQKYQPEQPADKRRRIAPPNQTDRNSPESSNNATTSNNSNIQFQPTSFHDRPVNESEQNAISQACANWIYNSGLPFDTTEHPLFKAFMATLRPSFAPPTRQALATTLLDQAHAEAQAQAQRLEALRQSQQRLSVAVAGDLNHSREESTVNYLRPDMEQHHQQQQPQHHHHHQESGGAADISHPLHPLW
ncbi:hypothetical protein Q7P37_005471 [Cladosporium fusiforme]